MPSYVMQTTHLPRQICDDIAKTARGFLWKDNEERRKIHFLSWKNVCKPKNQGGLGIRHLRENNQAFLMKNTWGLMKNKDALWVRVLRSKYSCGSDTIPVIKRKNGCSNLWRGICDSWNDVKEGLVSRVNNGSSVCFWKDRWVRNLDSLECYANFSFSDNDRLRKVKDFTTASGMWDTSKFAYFFLITLFDKLLVALPLLLMVALMNLHVIFGKKLSGEISG